MFHTPIIPQKLAEAQAVSTIVLTNFYTIQKVKTFTPASSDRAFVFAQLAKNIENALNALQHITGVICG